MSVERCPTCGQPLPAGLTRTQLEEKLKRDRDREILATMERERPKMETQLMAKLVPKAKAEAKKELGTEIDRARKEGRLEGSRSLDLERRRRERAELTAGQLQKKIKKLETQLSTASPDDQGAIAQEGIARAIRAACPDDEVSEVPRGQRGGDVIQDVRDKGRQYGRVLWEVKDQADWNEAWVAKAKDDGRRVSADYVVLATSAFPARTKTLAVRQGVILVAPELAATLALLLHGIVLNLAEAKAASTERAGKAAKILDYVGSTECRGRFEGIKDAIADLRKMQANERGYHDTHWEKEERLFTQIATASAGVRDRLEEIVRETPARLAARA